MIKHQQLIFFLLLIGISIGIFIASITRTQSASVARSMGVSEPTPASLLYYQKLSQVIPQSEYQLAYPGILPTHPLYNLKMVRDRIVLTLTPKSRRSSLLLLYSDKRLAAAEILVKQGNVDQAITVASKGMTYYWQSLEASPEFSQTNRAQLFSSLASSGQKYEDILGRLAVVSESAAHEQVVRLQNSLDSYQKHFSQTSP